MTLNLALRNIVLLGIFNSEKLDKYFLIKNSVIEEKDILPTSRFGFLGASQIITEGFQLLISPSQIVVVSNEAQSSIPIHNILINLINSLDNTNKITATGINFHWHLRNDDKGIHELSKELFFNDRNKLFSNYFNTETSHFGAYASRDYKESRLKLDIKPIIAQQQTDGGSKIDIFNAINFQYNFHFDATVKNTHQIVKWITDYNDYAIFAKEISGTFR